MMNKKQKRSAFFALAAFAASLVGISAAKADEGMWLYSNPPVKQVKEKYGVDLSSDLLEHLQKSSLRFATYGSASFVSSNGLIMTNHHVGLRTVTQLSTKENNLVLNGFKANSYEEELKCPGLQLVMLDQIKDVTAEVEASVAGATTEEETQAARSACIKKLEADAKAETGLTCTVVTLYQGGLYHMYCYKEFNDVRLVFTPEESVGFFGGDPDNFEYPRYNLDVTFFRAYENDQPYHPAHYLQWSENGAADGDLVLVSGHPARTNRFNTIADLEYQRDVYYPHMMSKYRRRESAMTIFKSTNEENARRIGTDLFGIQNSRKNRGGILQGLQSVALMQPKIDAENELRQKAKEQGVIDFNAGDPWAKIADAVNGFAGYFVAYDLLETGEAFYGNQEIARARAIVRYAVQAAKDDADRDEAYKGDKLEGRKSALMGGRTESYADVDLLKLSDSLSMLYEVSQPADGGRTIGKQFIPQDQFNAIFGGQSPKGRAMQVLKESKVFDKEFVENLLNGGLDAVKASTDPAIQIALVVNPIGAQLAEMQKKVEEIKRQEYAKIAKARFQIYGADVYPDATFTLRLSYGKACGYKNDEGVEYPFATNVQGAYDHAAEHNFADPYDLPKSWTDAEAENRAPKNSLINYVTTNDIIGGNSGSPAVNAKGEVIGLIFDGNVYSLVSNFTFEDVQSRAVLVHSQAIRDVVRDVYQLPALADELGK